MTKHANASAFDVELTRDEHAVTLTISDNGSGFDVSERKTERGTLGLVSMKERANLVQGNLEVESKLGMGTSVRARIPLPEVPA